MIDLDVEHVPDELDAGVVPVRREGPEEAHLSGGGGGALSALWNLFMEKSTLGVLGGWGGRGSNARGSNGWGWWGAKGAGGAERGAGVG